MRFAVQEKLTAAGSHLRRKFDAASGLQLIDLALSSKS